MRARLSDFKRQSSCGARARVLGQVRDCRNEGGDGTHFSESQQRQRLQFLFEEFGFSEGEADALEVFQSHVDSHLVSDLFLPVNSVGTLQ